MQAESTFTTPAARVNAEAPGWLQASGWRLCWAALLLGVAGDLLFHKQALGINVPLYVALLLGATAGVFLRAPSARVFWRNAWLAVPILFFAVMIFLRDEPVLTLLNVAATLLLLGVLTVTLGTHRLERLTVLAYPLAVVTGGILAAFSTFPLIGFALSRLNERGGRLNLAGRVALGLLLALPALVVFGVLFSAADAVFAQLMRQIVQLDYVPDLVLHALWIGFLAWVCGGALAMALTRAHQLDPMPPLESPLKATVHIGIVESATVLASVGAMFALFVAIQFTYLFGGNANIHIDGFTYAEYARRGFFELVWVAMLAMGLILGLDWLTLRGGLRARRLFKALCLVLIALVLVVLWSAFLRMSLYEGAYGFTSLRLYTHSFMLWMGAVFGLKALEIVFERRWIFAFGGFLSLIIALAGFNLLNPDAAIAQQNVQRYAATGKLDTTYAASMSADAVPVLAAAFDSLQGTERTQIGGALRAQMDRLYGRLEKAQWPSWHYARKQAIDTLLTQRELLNQFAPWQPSRYRFD